MIELHTNPDYLHRLASDTIEAGRDMTGQDINDAAQDIKNMRDYAESLERNTQQMSGEIQSIRTQRDEAAAALLAIIRPELEAMVKDAMQSTLGERLDDMQGDISDVQDRIEEIPSEDDITDAVREFMQYEAKFKITLE